MPPRNVLLFLKTEQVYTLTIFVETGSTNIIQVDHENDSLIQDANNPTPFFEIPIIARHFRDDTIIIEAIFKESFMELDWEYIQSQLIELNKTTLRRNENERLYIDGEGYNIDNQVIRFLMPARDFVLYLRAKDYRQELRLIREGTTDSFETVSISSGNGIPYFGKEFIDIQTGCVMEDANKWLISEFKKNEEVTITVHFEPKPEDNEKYYYEIDSEFLLAQLASININPRIFKTPAEDGYEGGDQSFTFTMPDGDHILTLQWIERLFEIDLDVNYKFVTSTDIIDTNILKNKTLDGSSEYLLQPRLPHSTYTIVIKKNILENIISNPNERFIGDYPDSYYIIPSEANIKKILIHKFQKIATIFQLIWDY